MTSLLSPSQLIALKRDGHALSAEQIASFVGGFLRGEIADYQMSALAMAIYIQGMDGAETAALTEQMLRSGEVLQWTGSTPKVDKHSTGGVGDKVSLILAPLVACCGLQVPMISGRGLGATGGTLDKLESIAGFRTNLSMNEICQLAEQVGCVITGASREIAPADKRLYALRDVTATVASIPLITASIMSKKLAENLDALLLDVKYGSGAFMKTIEQARALAQSLVETGRRMGVKTAALLTDMNQPLGRAIGNAVEVNEAADTLSGGGPGDLKQLTLALGSRLLLLVGRAGSLDQAESMLIEQLNSGNALRKFAEMVEAQGGDLEAPRPVAPPSEWLATQSGYIFKMDSERFGEAVIRLGGGRRLMSDRIDHCVGLEMLVRLGDHVVRGQPLVRIFASADEARRIHPLLTEAIVIDQRPPPPLPLIAELVE